MGNIQGTGEMTCSLGCSHKPGQLGIVAQGTISTSCPALRDLWAEGLTRAVGAPTRGGWGRCCPSSGALGSLVHGHQGSIFVSGLVN